MVDGGAAQRNHRIRPDKHRSALEGARETLTLLAPLQVGLGGWLGPVVSPAVAGSTTGSFRFTV